MDNQPNIEAKPMEVLMDKEVKLFKRAWKILCFYNLYIECGISIFNMILIYFVPNYYPYFQNQFLLTIAFAFFNIVITLKMKRSLQSFQSFISFLHFLWIFYGFATVPVFLTAVTSTLENCDPTIHACTKGFFNTDLFHTKMTTGLLAQAIFGCFLYGEMKRLCLLLTFPFVEIPNNTNQTETVDENKNDSESQVKDQLPEKNPNDIVIVA